MENSQQTQEILEQNFSGNQNFFFEKISAFLSVGVETGKIESTLSLLKHALNDDKEYHLSVDEFQTIGSLAYLVGIDYTSQQYLTKKVCENVAKRFENHKISSAILSDFIFINEQLGEVNIFDAVDEMKTKMLEKVVLKNAAEKQAFVVARGIARLIIGNSIVPVNMAVGINDVVTNKETTYQDVLKFNSIINKQCKYNGNSVIKNVFKLYSDTTFRKVLNTATEYFDNQKFASIYLDSIFSINEANKRLNLSLGDFLSVLDGTSLTTFDFDGLKQTWEENQSKANSEKEAAESPETYKGLPESETKLLMDENPTRFVFEVFCDLLKKKITTPEEVLEAVDSLVNDIEAGQHIYTFMKLSLGKITVDSDMGLPNIKDIEKIANEIDIQFHEKQTKLKSMIEKVCEDIPENIHNRIVTYVNLCIGDLILADDKQKQYLMSQIAENQINTYNQLQQIVSMIETCDINGKDLESYVILHNYLKNNTTIVDIFELAEKQEEEQTKLTILKSFLDYFGTYLALHISKENA